MGDRTETETCLPSLFDLSLQAAIGGEYWRVQRRQLAYLPDEGSNALLAGLLGRRRMEAPQLELFQYSVSVVELDGALLPSLGANWLAYLAKFRVLQELRLPRCVRLRDAHLAMLAPLAPTLRVLSLAGCTGLTASSAPHLTQLTGLESLDLTDTQMGPPTTRSLSSLTALTSLQLGGVPTSDTCCIALARLSRLQRLVLWGSEVSDTGMRELEHLSALTALDLSLTRCRSPPIIPVLCQLSMIHCQLDVVGEDREALWLDMGATLPSLRELHLQSANCASPRGTQLLHQLVGGAAGGLRHLHLGTCNVADLAFLEPATSLTYLDLSGTPIYDALLGSLSLLPLHHLALADTGVTDEGVGQLLGMTTLTHLDLKNSQAGDGALAVLAQLPALQCLDLSGTEFAGNLSASSIPGALLSLTSLSLLDSRVGDRGCKLLAKAAPALGQLQLGSASVTDAGVKLLARLAALTSLTLDGCMVSDHGLAFLEGLPALQQLQLDNCWLLSEAELRSLLRGMPGLADVRLNGAPLQAAAAAPGKPASPSPNKLSPASVRRQRGSSNGTAGAKAGAKAAPRAAPSAGSRFGRLPEDLLQYDERIKYSREELLEVQGGATCAAQHGRELLALHAQLPVELRRG